MLKYRFESAFVTICAFLVGAMLAMCVAPGDILLTIVAGLALTLFAHAFFVRELGGDLIWPWTRPRNNLFVSPFRFLVSKIAPRAAGRHAHGGDPHAMAERLTFRKAHRHGN